MSFFHAKSQGDLSPLGSYAIPAYGDINGKRAVLLVGPSPDQPLLKAPAVVWNDTGSGPNLDCAIWRPVAPPGYVAMGDVVVRDEVKPPTFDKIWCLRVDLTRMSSYEASDIWNDANSGAPVDCSCWKIITESNGVNGSELLPVPPGTFRARNSWTKPETFLAVVPLLKVPNQYVKFTYDLPKVTPTTIPRTGDKFGQQEQCHVTLPFISFLPNDDERSLARITTPFYTINRSIAWDVEGVWVNDSAGAYKREKKITFAITQTQSSQMTQTAGVSISASYGIAGFESGITLNYQFTQTNFTSFTEFTEQKVTESFDVPAKTATVLFSKHIWLRATAGDGTVVSQIEMAANDDVHFGGCNL
ncbi:hypothetical protein ACMFMG_001184 [Clarireedia jacksonii]